MTMLVRPSADRRFVAATAAVMLEAVLAYALILGFTVTIPAISVESLKLVDIAPPAAQPPPPVPRPTSNRPEGAASPPNLRARATEIVAPPPAIPLPVPSKIVAAPVAGPGTAPWAGAADVPGPGTGSGGIGNGFGGGGDGDGDGAGGGAHTPPRRLRGQLRDSDFPLEAAEEGASGTVSVRFSVEVDGRVGRCLVVQSSGSPALDSMTCRLIQQRYRFRPSLDSRGRPVRSQVIEDHSWFTFDDPEPPRESRRRRRLF